MNQHNYEMISVEYRKTTCLITIQRPEVQNRINRQAVKEISEAIFEANERADVRVIVLTGEGNEYFCGGGQIDSFPDGYIMEQRSYADGTVELQQVIYASSKPILAAVQARAFAGGLSVMVACDMAIAAEDSTFGLIELVKNGQFPMIAIAANIIDIPKKLLFEMVYRGKLLSAQEALDLHIINEIVPQNEVLNRTLAIADEIAKLSGTAITIGRQSYYEMVNMPQNAAYSYAKAALLNLLWTEDVQETAHAKQEKREPKWVGK